MKKPSALGPWPAGLWNSVPAASVPASGLTEATNVDVLETGAVKRRGAWAKIDDTPAHSLFEHNGRVLGVSGGEVGVLDANGFTPFAPVSGPLSWTVLNGDAVFCDHEAVRVVRGDAVESFPVFSREDEAELLLMPLPGGAQIEYWAGRLVVARGNSLLFSEPLRYGAHDPMRGFIQFEERIYWFAPLDSGIFVGLRNSVRWLAGTSPGDMQQARVGGKSWRGACAVVTTEHMNPEVQAERVALWMTPTGFAVGLPGGNVQYPQAERLKGLPMYTGRMVVDGDRVTVLSS
jgi:hypothetical protein